MEIKDLRARQGNVDITATVVEKGDVREFEKFGKKGRVCNAKIRDSTGSMTLTLWNEQADNVNSGDKVHITNGWVSEWQGEKQLSTGKFGKLEVVGKGDSFEAEEKSEGTAEAEKKSAKSDDDSESGEEPGEETDEDIVRDEEEIG